MNAPSEPTEDDIRKQVRLFWANWSKRPSEEEQAAWARSLGPHWNKPGLRQAMRDAVERGEEWIPSVPTLLARMRTIEHGAPKADEVSKPLTDRERRRAERAAVLSLLWLHYELGWPLERVGAHMIATALGADPVRAIAAAKEQYTPETIRRWMADQAAHNPAPCDKVLGRYLAG
jgi:hypothetical protein